MAQVKAFEPGVDAKGMGLEVEGQGRVLRKKFNPLKVAAPPPHAFPVKMPSFRKELISQ